MLVPIITNWLISSSFVYILFLKLLSLNTMDCKLNALQQWLIMLSKSSTIRSFFKTYLNYLLFEVRFKQLILNFKSAISRINKSDFGFIWNTGI